MPRMTGTCRERGLATLRSMDRIRYRSYLVRTWQVAGPDPDATRVRVEWIARGEEVEVRGRRADNLAVALADAFGPEPPPDDAAPDEAVETVSKGGA